MQRLTEISIERCRAGVFTRTEVAAWLRGSADAEAGLVKRSLAAGEIIRLCRGLYCLGPRYRNRPVDSLVIAQRITGPSYVSLEAALAFHGWLPEAVESVTSVCDSRSRSFRTPLGQFSFTHIPQRRLFEDVHRVERPEGQAALIASPLKSLADYVYAHHLDWTGVEPLLESLRIPPSNLAEITPSACQALIANYRSRRVQRFLAGLAGEVTPCPSN
jgi:hypothetical protein